MSANDDALLAQIAERRNDEAFMDRLRQRMAEDAPLMLRLQAGECRTARLIESRDGGTTLVYECECGAQLIRTRSQAEADAAQANAEATKPAKASEVADDHVLPCGCVTPCEGHHEDES